MEGHYCAPPPDARLKGLVDSHQRKPRGNLRPVVSCEDQDLLGYRRWGGGGEGVSRILSVPDPVQVAARWGGAARRQQPGGCRQRARVRCLMQASFLWKQEFCVQEFFGCCGQSPPKERAPCKSREARFSEQPASLHRFMAFGAPSRAPGTDFGIQGNCWKSSLALEGLQLAASLTGWVLIRKL